MCLSICILANSFSFLLILHFETSTVGGIFTKSLLLLNGQYFFGDQSFVIGPMIIDNFRVASSVLIFSRQDSLVSLSSFGNV